MSTSSSLIAERQPETHIEDHQDLQELTIKSPQETITEANTETTTGTNTKTTTETAIETNAETPIETNTERNPETVVEKEAEQEQQSKMDTQISQPTPAPAGERVTIGISISDYVRNHVRS